MKWNWLRFVFFRLVIKLSCCSIWSGYLNAVYDKHDKTCLLFRIVNENGRKISFFTIVLLLVCYSAMLMQSRLIRFNSASFWKLLCCSIFPFVTFSFIKSRFNIALLTFWFVYFCFHNLDFFFDRNILKRMNVGQLRECT